MDNIETTTKPSPGPKDFFLNLGVFVGLYVSAISLLNLLFEIINLGFPDKLETYVDPYSTGIRWAIAMLVIFFPAYIFLTWTISKDINRNPEKRNYWIKRWLAYLTLFVAGLTIAIDLVTLINSFLGGEITTRFVLKVLAVLIVAAVVFGFYIYDLKRIPGQKSSAPKMYAYLTCTAVLLSLIGGFIVMGSPATARERRFDDQRINDLSSIQMQTVTYWQAHRKLPQSLNDLNDSISGYTAPTDPDTKQVYEYSITGNMSFQLCATFGLDNVNSNLGGRTNPIYTPYGYGSDNWTHKAGHQCFSRTIDPKLYPPIESKTVPTTGVTPKGL